VTYGFRLTVVLTHGERLKSDEREIHLDLAAPIGRVTLRSSPPETPFSEAGQLVFIGGPYESRKVADHAGRALKNAVQLAAVDARTGLDVGKDVVRTSPGQVVIDQHAENGILLLPEVHGLLVYEETGTPMVLAARADFTVQSPLGAFTAAIAIRVGAPILDEKRSRSRP
jgi:hypothetical protein